MSIKLYKNCLHCDAELVQRGPGRKKIYCNRRHAEAFRKDSERMAAQMSEELGHIEIALNLIWEGGPVMVNLPPTARREVRNGVPMRVV